MTVLRQTHDPYDAVCGTIGTMNDPAQSDGRVLPLPAAPNAIELRHLRAFTAVAEELNFARAAARLYLSAPALSRQIRELERLVGCDLFRRSTHRVELTLAGEALLDRIRGLLTDLDDAIVRARSVGGELSERMARLWSPVAESRRQFDLQGMRDAYEAMLSQSDVPADVHVRPVNAAGVPSLVLTTRPDQPATLLYLHGGAYISGSAFGFRPLCGAIAAASGATVLLPEYRLAPENPFPAALHDAARAYRWMLDQEIAPEQITISGDSSGAGLAMSLLLDIKDREEPMPGGAALLCPLVDLTGQSLADRVPDAAQPMMTTEMFRYVADQYLAGYPIDDPLVAPLKADLTGLPPLLLQAGAGDPVLDDARRLAEHAQRHGVEVSLELYPVDTHVFQLFWSFLPEAADAIQKVSAFSRRGTSPARTA